MTQWIDLDKKVVIITGGAVGIGAKLTENLHGNGAQVVIADVSIDEEYESEGIDYIACDVTKKQDVDRLVSEVNYKYGKVEDRKSTRLNSSHVAISYAVFCLKKKKNKNIR